MGFCVGLFLREELIVKKHLGNSVEKMTRRQMVAGSVLGGVTMVLSACGGGGGGGSSSDEIDLVAAYERVEACMTYDQVVEAVGVRPNEHDSENTMKWEHGGYYLLVQLQFNHADSKELMRSNGQQIKRMGFPEYCR